MGETWTIRGREINENDINFIRKVIGEHFHKGRKHISRQLCHYWRWYQPSGHTKDRACRDILLFLEKQNIIELPPRRNSGNNKRKIEKIILKEAPLTGTVKHHPSLNLKLLTDSREHKLWKGIVDQYHYQGYRVIVGKSLDYIAFIDDKPVACLGWGSAAWSLIQREKWIGWDKKTKDKNLGRIVNNIRFLILPWVKVKYLASHLLSLSVKRIHRDWLERYGEPIYLLETFVEKERFSGTCYKAANWIYLGSTKGSAKRGASHYHHGNIKDIYVYPLCKDFREQLVGR